MNIVVQNRREVEFDLADLEVTIKDYIEQGGPIVSTYIPFTNIYVQYFMIEVRLLSQIWILRRRYSDFDKMHKRIIQDLDYRAAENLPDLPPKRVWGSKAADFIQERLKLLNKYLKFVILIYEAIENPILQRFLEIDTRFNPRYDYEEVDVAANSEKRSASDDSETFLEMDKYMKARFRHVLNKEQGPNNMAPAQPNEILHQLYEIEKKKKQAIKIKGQMELAMQDQTRQVSMHDYYNLKQHLGLIKED